MIRSPSLFLVLWLTLLLPIGPALAESPATAPLRSDSIVQLEEEVGGRIGVHAFNAAGDLLSYRADERFAMCSTFKWALAAAVFDAVADGDIDLDERIPLRESDLVMWAPVTEKLVQRGEASVLELVTATVTVSDNPAANLLLKRIGGLAQFNEFMRSLGDPVTSLDRFEPELNSNAPGDERDATSPRAMARSILKLAGTDGPLPESLRLRLIHLVASVSTGNARIRAGTPPNWLVGNKTGSCGTAYNDIAVVWPLGADPYAIAVYVDRPTADRKAVEAAIASLARRVAESIDVPDSARDAEPGR